jgi:hypothetical protein
MIAIFFIIDGIILTIFGLLHACEYIPGWLAMLPITGPIYVLIIFALTLGFISLNNILNNNGEEENDE